MQDEENKIIDDTQEEVLEDDVTFEEENNESDAADGASAVAKLREKLKVAVEEKQKYLDGWQRDKAEFINARKRDEEDKKNLLKYAEANLIGELIPVLDAFDMAMANKEAWEKADKNWRVGVEYIYSQLNSTLQGHGLAKIDPIGQAFDPNHHHSVAIVETGRKDQDGVVLEVVAFGYSLNGKQIREPQVKVGQFEI